MIISSRQRLTKIDDDPEISLDGIDIQRVKQAKTLGIVIDEKLQCRIIQLTKYNY
jgi:hypothetical protein